MLNQVQLIGHLGGDPEVRYTAGGEAVTNYSVATTEKWFDKASGERRERTEWHRITAFGRAAEVAGEYLRKGSKVFVQGRLQTDKWTDKEGNERYTTKVMQERMVMLSGREEGGDRGDRQQGGGQSGGGQRSERPQQRQSPPPQQGNDNYTDDDIPF